MRGLFRRGSRRGSPTGCGCRPLTDRRQWRERRTSPPSASWPCQTPWRVACNRLARIRRRRD